jgi:3'(2'), 5'-bisphosphate nucleotidase
MIVTEGGGRVTDTRGGDLDFSRGRKLERNLGVVATNGRLHEAVIAAVKDVLGAD